VIRTVECVECAICHDEKPAGARAWVSLLVEPPHPGDPRPAWYCPSCIDRVLATAARENA
jgi:hypothetical protein